jgi:hypothetical protein
VSLHRTFTETERAALRLHGLNPEGPSQLSDAFVLGMRHIAPDLTEDQWLALAERHLNSDWNSDKPDGYLNAVKALVRDALSTAGVPPREAQHPNDEQKRDTGSES